MRSRGLASPRVDQYLEEHTSSFVTTTTTTTENIHLYDEFDSDSDYYTIIYFSFIYSLPVIDRIEYNPRCQNRITKP
jgi:hypothetical protein